MSKPDGGPAFPHFQPHRFKSFDIERGIAELESGDTQFPGMSLRDYFAATAMAQIFIKPLLNIAGERVEINWGNLDIDGERVQEIVNYCASLSYLVADTMLAEREKS